MLETSLVLKYEHAHTHLAAAIENNRREIKRISAHMVEYTSDCIQDLNFIA